MQTKNFATVADFLMLEDRCGIEYDIMVLNPELNSGKGALVSTLAYHNVTLLSSE